MRCSYSSSMKLRRRTLLAAALLGSTSGCSQFQSGETATFVDTFGHTTDRRLIPTQPELSDPPTSWVTHTTNPDRADELFPWDDLIDRFGNAAPGTNAYRAFEPGERCVVFVVFNSRNEEVQLFEQSDAKMFDSGRVELESLTFPDIDIPRYQYVGAAWDLGDVDVPDEFTVQINSD